jgi:phosphatidylserine/phosphatidylglycerophosphate/cardiolipin synthase-like enzyme
MRRGARGGVITLDCHLRLVYWNASASAYVGLPAGIPVDAIDAGGLRADRVVARGFTGEGGSAHLRVDPGHERRPDLYFRYRVPDELPAAIDLATNTLSASGLPIPRQWSTYASYALEDPDRPGYWPDHAGDRLGDPDQPYVFDVRADAPRLRAGNAVQPIIDGVELLRRFEALIASAAQSIHLETMLYFNDPIGWRITNLLIEKARQGVDVRLMFDVRTTMDSYRLYTVKRLWVRELIDMPDEDRAAKLAQLQKDEDAEKIRGDTGAIRAALSAEPHVRFIDTSFPYVEIMPRPPSAAPPAYQEITESLPFFTVARIDHRKMLVVDGEAVILGGQNIGQEYMYDTPFDPLGDPAVEHLKWHDVAIEIHGPAVRDVQALFRERWVEEGGDAFDYGPRELGVGLDPSHPIFPRLEAIPGGKPVAILNTTPGVRLEIRDDLFERFASAEREILIEVAYFTNQDAWTYLQMAAERGVRVVCIFPDDPSDSLDFVYAARLFYADLIRSGVEVYEYQPRMTHAKVIIVDGVSIAGSANLNNASLYNHYEVNAVIPDAEITAAFEERLFKEDLYHCLRIEEGDLPSLTNISAVARVYLKGIVRPLF